MGRQQSGAEIRYDHNVVSGCRGNPVNCLVQKAHAVTQLPSNRPLRWLIFFPVPLLLGCAILCSQAQVRRHMSPLATGLGNEFASESAKVNGIMLHYVRAGNGPAVILIHGFPQDWFEYHAIMPQLAKQFTVIAVDLRGVGASTTKPGGYDAPNMAEDVHQLVAALKLDRVYIVGHDIGGHVAYAFVRRYPEATRGAMILDTPIPGIAGWDEMQGHPAMWHVRFMQVPGLAEKLVAGRQA